MENRLLEVNASQGSVEWKMQYMGTSASFENYEAKPTCWRAPKSVTPMAVIGKGPSGAANQAVWGVSV
jgi:phage-related protein